MATRFCIHCGQPIAAGTRFCPSCGQPQTTPTPGTPSSPTTAPPPMPSGYTAPQAPRTAAPPKRGPSILLPLIGLVVIVAVVFGAISLWQSIRPSLSGIPGVSIATGQKTITGKTVKATISYPADWLAEEMELSGLAAIVVVENGEDLRNLKTDVGKGPTGAVLFLTGTPPFISATATEAELLSLLESSATGDVKAQRGTLGGHPAAYVAQESSDMVGELWLTLKAVNGQFYFAAIAAPDKASFVKWESTLRGILGSVKFL